jgi:predicted DNA-binding antitoxin AbrB/MazE fold protein
MNITFDATYENGVLRPKKPMTLAEGAKVRVTLQASDEKPDPLKNVIGIGAGGRRDGATNHDRYIYGTRKRR